MDFELAFFISVHITAIIMLVSIAIYGTSIRKVIPNVTKSTRNALLLLGFAGLALIPIALTDLYFIDTLWLWAGLFFGMLSLSLQSVFYAEEEKGKTVKYATIVLILLVVVESILRISILPWLPIYGELAGMAILMVSSLIFSVLLLRETVSTFTISLLLLQIVFIASWFLWLTQFISENQSFFIIQAAPMLLAAAIFASVSRHWKTMVSFFLVGAMVNLGIALSWSAFIAGDVYIYQFVIVAIIAGLSVIVPLNYFIQQAIESKARTPLYMGMVLITLAALVIAHSNSWAIYITNGRVWNEYFTFLDLVLGTIAVMSFVLAGASAGFSEVGYRRIRDVVLWLAAMMIALGIPFVRIVEETGVMRWKVAALYPVLLGAIAVGVIFFIKVSLRIHRRGATRAAQTFMLFIMSSLSLGLVIMFSDIFLTANIFVANQILLLIATTLALVSSPPVLARLSRKKS